MAIITERFPQCDNCFECFADWQRQPPPTVKQLRIEMKREGWQRKNGKDICDDCVQGRKI